MNIKEGTEVNIFKNDKGYYSIGLSKKDRNNQVYYGYFPCQFKKDVSVENKTRIKIKNAFMSFYIKDDKTMPYIMIIDYSIVDKDYLQIKEKMEEDGLPF